jgi:hypothetical protein
MGFAAGKSFELSVKGAILLAEALLEQGVVVGACPAINGYKSGGIVGGGEQFGTEVTVGEAEELRPVALGLVRGDEITDAVRLDCELARE